MTASAPDPVDGQVIYLYCLTDARRLCGKTVCPDDGPTVIVHPVGDVAAVIQSVPRAEFCGEAADERLRDISWLAPRVCLHQAVIDRAMRFSPVFPLGFGTLFGSTAGLATFVRANRQAIRCFLDCMVGKEEWALKAHVVLDHPSAGEGLAVARHPELAEAAPGTRYLLQRRLQPMLAQEHRRMVADEAERLLTDLAVLGHTLRDLSPRPGSEPPGRFLLRNCAVLVDSRAVSEFRRDVERLAQARAERGLEVTLSGPWPPFSFVPALAAAMP